ncbi:hypothetical protein EYF80_056818 [Liparis tanakae]|uniref:Uncharacterized protein n=1 Tax=Liparis tanakae TaxID=230148 RepID=A0A4Z2EVU9_9TELE|nr:hypothetical protein EYF80_056818 [Liparis tanakae]
MMMTCEPSGLDDDETRSFPPRTRSARLPDRVPGAARFLLASSPPRRLQLAASLASLLHTLPDAIPTRAKTIRWGDDDTRTLRSNL